MNETVYILILAVLQGIGEFLPISSSGHLVIGKALLSEFWPQLATDQGGIQLEVALHVGTLGSILVVYFRDLWQLRRDWRLCLLIILASVPAGFVGLTFKDALEELFQSPLFAGFGLLITAVFLLLGQRQTTERYTTQNLPWLSALIVGCFQAVAILPGISRSGSTIAGGLLVGMQRSSAATFSFLMALVAIGGAALLEAKDLLNGEPLAYSAGGLLMGVVVSFVTGVIALTLLLRVLHSGRLYWFAYYCLAVGMATILWQVLRTGVAH